MFISTLRGSYSRVFAVKNQNRKNNFVVVVVCFFFVLYNGIGYLCYTARRGLAVTVSPPPDKRTHLSHLPNATAKTTTKKQPRPFVEHVLRALRSDDNRNKKQMNNKTENTYWFFFFFCFFHNKVR